MTKSDKRIIYTGDNDQVYIIIPADECPLTLEQIQAKDVPNGKESWIVDKSEIPTDRSFRNAWTYTP